MRKSKNQQRELKNRLRQYYDLRRQTKDFGYTDREYPRYEDPIHRDEDLTITDLSRVLACIEEEKQILIIARNESYLNEEASQRENRSC